VGQRRERARLRIWVGAAEGEVDRAKDAVARRWERLARVPAVVAAWDDPSIAGQPLLRPFLEQLKNVRPLPAVSTWNEVSTLLGKAMESVARGKESAAAAMADVQKQADSIGTD
jgi:multiple sugar transport system substrate-binding protein